MAKPKLRRWSWPNEPLHRRSVRGPGNRTPQLASLFKSTLVAGGFAEEDVTTAPADDTGQPALRTLTG